VTEFTSDSPAPAKRRATVTSPGSGLDERAIRLAQRGQIQRSAEQLLRGGLMGSAVGAVVSVVVMLGVGHDRPGPSATGAVVGALLVAVVFAVPPVLLRTSSQWPPPVVMAVALLAYGATVLLLTVAWVLITQWSAVSNVAVGVGVAITTTGALVGQIRAAGRWRLLAFGVDEPPPTLALP
jgi:hypothetical protein